MRILVAVPYADPQEKGKPEVTTSSTDVQPSRSRESEALYLEIKWSRTGGTSE